MKAKKAGWPKQAQVHSPENRIGQAWRPGSVQVFVQVYRDTFKLFDIPEGLFRCGCGAVVRIDQRGYAYCEACGDVFNSGKAPSISSTRERKRRIEKLKYECVNSI